jgi:uncharacterized OB-fold protein
MGDLAPLYAATARGTLAMPFCGQCGLALELEQDVCDGCAAGDVEWRQVSPHGTVSARTTVHRREPGLIRATSPFQVLDVELRSGHRLVMTTDGPVGRILEIGEQVDIGFRRVGGVSIPAVAAGSRPAASKNSPSSTPISSEPEERR